MMDPMDVKLRRYDDWIYWSRERIEGAMAYFFANGYGNRRHDGSRVELADSNMGCASMLGYPIHFDAAAFRLYPARAQDRALFLDFAGGCGVEEHVGMTGHQHVPALFTGGERKPLDVRHRPLLTPSPIPAHAVSRKEMEALLAFVNGEGLPCIEVSPCAERRPGCAIAEPPRPGRQRIDPVECFMWRADAVSAQFDRMELIAVLIGDLWQPT